MRIVKLLLLLAVVFLCAGCLPVLSLHPLATGNDVVAEPLLLGTWQAEDSNDTITFIALTKFLSGNDKETVAFRKAFKNYYFMTYTIASEDKEKPRTDRLFACLVKMRGVLFLDITPSPFDESISPPASHWNDPNAGKIWNDTTDAAAPTDSTKKPEIKTFSEYCNIPVHLIYRVKVDHKTLRLEALDDEWLQKMLDAKRLRIKMEQIGDRPVITSSSAQLRAFIRRYAKYDKAFEEEEAEVWQRQKQTK
jgi:hypothetical protein